MPMNYDEILSASGLPEWATQNGQEVEDYTFYKSGDSSAVHKVSLPVPLEFLPLNIYWLRENSIKTVGDFIHFLNGIGWNSTLQTLLSPRGVTFDPNRWVWGTRENDDTDLMIRTYCSNGNSVLDLPDMEESLVFKDVTCMGLGTKFKFKRQKAPSSPQWMYEKQHYKFTPNQFDFKKLANEHSPDYLGLELEVGSDVSMATLQAVVCDVEPKQEPFFYFKHDGSIDMYTEDRFEIVTQPCSPRYLRKNLKIFFEKLEKLGLLDKIHTNSSCGVHVHTDSEAFNSELHRKKFITVFNQYDKTNKDFIQKLGRRMFTNYCKNSPSMEGLTVPRRIRRGLYANGHSSEKYSSCRQTNSTIEVRIFKGEFNYEHVKYCIDTVLAMKDFCEKLPLRLISSPLFKSEFLSWLRGSKYMKLAKEIL